MRDNSATSILVIRMLCSAATVLVLSTTKSSPNFHVEAFPGSPISGGQKRYFSNGRSPKSFSRANYVHGSMATPASLPTESEEYPVGGTMRDLFQEKIFESFSNAKSRRDDDDLEPNGAFQPSKDSMIGTVVVVTGASTGLGLESAMRLTLAGATVILTSRTPEKALRAVQAVRDYCRGDQGSFSNQNPIVRGIALDLDDMASVRSFPDRYRDCMLPLSKISDQPEMVVPPRTRTRKIDILMNNAGCGGLPSRNLTVDGNEKIFQSCHLGHFLLTARLFEEGLLNDGDGDEKSDTTSSGGGCTVIAISSILHRAAEVESSSGNETPKSEKTNDDFGFDFDNINSELDYDPTNAYAQGKIANVMFVRELQKRADLAVGSGNDETRERKRSWLTAVSLEPGIVSTDIWRHSELGYDPRTFDIRRSNGEALEQPKNWNLPLSLIANRFFFDPIEQGANTQIWLAYASSIGVVIPGGQHYDEYRNTSPALKASYDEESNKRLWEVSEELAGIKFDLETSQQ